jgi:hypothetical protein
MTQFTTDRENGHDERTDTEPGPSTNTDVARQTPTHRTRVPVAGGVLVYEPRQLGRELVGFEAVDDWSDIRAALTARGHGVGAIHHLPVLDGSTP